MPRKKLLNTVGGVVGLLALAGLAVILALTFARQTPSSILTATLAVWQVATPTSAGETFDSPLLTPTEAHKELSPTATATLGSVFDSPIKTPTPGKPTPTVPVPDLDDYVFGEPKIVLTDTAAVGIACWLPDGERLLIVRSIPDKPREYIETFNIYTGELRRYGERRSVPVKPIWLDKLDKVAFADVSEHQYNLWISDYGQEQAKEAVFSDVEFPMAGGEDIVLVVPRKQRQVTALDKRGKAASAQAIDLTAYGFKPDDVLTYFRMAISPDGERLAAYDRENLSILDLKAGIGQSFDLGIKSPYEPDKIWAFHAEWSPNGHYLAMLTTSGDLPLTFTNLTVMDAAAGELRTIDLEPRYVTDIAWSPNSRHIVIRAVVFHQEGRNKEGIFLVDALTGKHRRIFPDAMFGASSGWTWNIAWSPKDNSIIFSCPIPGEARLCIAPFVLQQ